MIDWDLYPNFTREEFECRCGCGRADMDPEFMNLLQKLRTICEFPFPISSGYRCQEHNQDVGGGPAHMRGKAADVAIYGEQAWELAALSAAIGFTGLGVQQKGDVNRRFIHLDTLRTSETEAPRPWIWSY